MFISRVHAVEAPIMLCTLLGQELRSAWTMAAAGESNYHMLPQETGSPSHSKKEEKNDTMVNVAPLGSHAVSSKVATFTSGLATLEDWWFLEVLGILLSAGALIAIAIILSHFDNAPQPQWATVSLNTLVSWLSTLAKAMVLIPVSRGLAQLKWTWMAEKERALTDLQTFDNASRGLIGSLVLLFEQPGRCKSFCTCAGESVLTFIGIWRHWLPLQLCWHSASIPSYRISSTTLLNQW